MEGRKAAGKSSGMVVGHIIISTVPEDMDQGSPRAAGP